MNTNRSTQRSGSGGFTLVELMITILVASILVTLAVPSFSRFVTSSRLAEQTNDLIAAIHFTRSEAIKRNARLTLCRVASENATACAGSAGGWQHWLVRNAAGQVVRRGRVNTYNGSLQITATLVNDSLEFGSDGLARTGGVLVNAGVNETAQGLRICSSAHDFENIRAVELGAGSRVSTTKASGTC